MTSKFPEAFLFTQTNLNDWLVCQRRFQYRHLERRAYPAPETADMLVFEEHKERGEHFHHLVHQYFSGIDPAYLEKRVSELDMLGWWNAFQSKALALIPSKHYPETTLTAPLGKHRLLAKYDLIAVDPDGGRLVIADWKTGYKRPSQYQAQTMMQTIVYRYVAVRAGAYYLGQSSIEPEQVEMIYWYANHPNQPEILRYNTEQYEQDELQLTQLAKDITTANNYPKVSEANKDQACRFCVYRSLCWDNVMAGASDEMDNIPDPDESPDFDIDLDQIQEVAF